MYDFADDEDPPPAPQACAAPVAVEKANAAKSKTKTTAAGTLGYRGAPTKREKDRFSQSNLMDLRRDVYVPVALLAAGMLIYAAYFDTAFRLSSRALPYAILGVGLITAFKTVLLIAFAFVIAGPVGVSFGGIWTAILKLAAVAVVCDGVTSWVDYEVQRSTGLTRGANPLGFGPIGFPVALLIYWTLYIYLFDMDSRDSWIVTRFLFIFDRVVRWALFALLINLFVHLTPSGVAHSGSAGNNAIGQGTSSLAANDPLSAHVQDLKDTDSLIEARKYIASGNQAVFGHPAEAWYAAGCPNVWFEMGHPDINGRRDAYDVIVELPSDRAARAKCFDTLKAYYDGVQIQFEPAEMKDTGQVYLRVMMR